jgi:hypothetical protein
LWAQPPEGLILLAGYLWLLYHVRTGNKNTWLTWVTIMLVLTNVGKMMTWHVLAEIYLNGSISALAAAELGAGVALKYGFFTTSHFLLAKKYAAMARRIPSVLEGRPEIFPTRCEEVSGTVLMVLNIMAPIVQGVGTGFLRYMLFVRG